VARIFNTYGPRMHPNDGRVVSNKADEIVSKWVDFFVLHKSIKPERITRRLK
jgi:hypothetical protein